MKNSLLLTLSILFSLTFYAQASFEWVNQIGTSGFDYVGGVAPDYKGNVYVTGTFSGTVDFDPGPGVNSLTSNGYTDVFIKKLDSLGGLVWVKQVGGLSFEQTYSVSSDSSGNVYCSGGFGGQVDFDPGSGVHYESAVQSGNMFIQKLDSLGDFVWVKTMVGVGSGNIFSTAVAPNGDVISTGLFYYTLDFDPGTGTESFTGDGQGDIFVQKLDLNGNFLWAKQIGGPSFDHGYCVKVDNSNNVYVLGDFSDTVSVIVGLGTTQLISSGQEDIFIAKLDALGNFLWAKKIGGIDRDVGRSLVTDDNNNIYCAGFFSSTVDFDPGAGVVNFTSNGSHDIYIQKLDSNGNHKWVNRMGGTGLDLALGIDLHLGSLYTTGKFQGTVDLNPSNVVTNLTANGGADVFIQNIDTSGYFLWAKQVGGVGQDYGWAIALDQTGDIYTIGSFESTVDFDPDTGVSNLTSFGNTDVFVLKMSQCVMNGSIDTQVACDSLTWINGITYYASYNTVTDTLVNAGGCDSIVTLNLTILQPTYAIDTITACDSLTWINGITYYANNATAVDTLVNAAGCDSIVTLNLTILQPTYSVDTITACDSFIWINGVTYTASNSTAIDTIINAQGCDSVISLNLTINAVDSSVTAAGDSITATQLGASYQWFDCNSSTPVSGAINQTFEPVVSGNYAVEVTMNGCVDTSVCTQVNICSANAQYSYTDNGLGAYSFTNNSTGSFTQVNWSFGDGTSNINNSPSHTYLANGNYVVVLAIHDSSTNSTCIDYFIDTISVTSVVNSLTCQAGFSVYADTVNGGVSIVNSSIGTNLTYSWNFGDGSTSTQQYPSHSYATAGPFNLCLTIDDGNGCTDTFCDSIGSNGVVFKAGGFDINVVSSTPLSVKEINITSGFTVFPNPATNEFQLELKSWGSKKVDIKIIDVNGKTIRTKSIANVSGNQTISFSTSNWSRGVYFIQITDGVTRVTEKLILQ